MSISLTDQAAEMTVEQALKELRQITIYACRIHATYRTDRPKAEYQLLIDGHIGRFESDSLSSLVVQVREWKAKQ